MYKRPLSHCVTSCHSPCRHWWAGTKGISMANSSKRQLSFGVLLKIIYQLYLPENNYWPSWETPHAYNLLIKGEVHTINDRNICERRSCMKNNGKSPTFKFVSGEERRPSEVQRVSWGWRLPGATHRQRISLGSENDWKFRLRSCQSWKASSLSLAVVVPT